MAYTTIDDPEAYFQARAYTGNGSADTSITFDGDTDLEPDLLWIKNRDASSSHLLFDAVRGVGKRLLPDTAAAESDEVTIASFDSDGWTMDADTGNNGADTGYVAWCWKESATAGFDIVTYTGDAADDTNISHSLSAVPEMIIIKDRTEGDREWVVGHKGLTTGINDYCLLLSTNAAEIGANATFFTTAPTSSVFTPGSNNELNKSGSAIVAYLFAGKQGFSKFGTWTSNNTTDNAFVWCGFRPALLIMKSVNSTNNWVIFDNKRDTYNVTQHKAYPDVANAEATSENDLDFLSNGFKMRAGYGAYSFVFMAFAEAPFVNSNGVPNNAR